MNFVVYFLSFACPNVSLLYEISGWQRIYYHSVLECDFYTNFKKPFQYTSMLSSYLLVNLRIWGRMAYIIWCSYWWGDSALRLNICISRSGTWISESFSWTSHFLEDGVAISLAKPQWGREVQQTNCPQAQKRQGV